MPAWNERVALAKSDAIVASNAIGDAIGNGEARLIALVIAGVLLWQIASVTGASEIRSGNRKMRIRLNRTYQGFVSIIPIRWLTPQA